MGLRQLLLLAGLAAAHAAAPKCSASQFTKSWYNSKSTRGAAAGSACVAAGKSPGYQLDAMFGYG